MPSPDQCRFTDSHEWHRLDGDIVAIGLTPFAVNELTDITYVEMRPAGTRVGTGEPLGEVESVKATSDVYAGVGGEIVEVNEALADDPSLVNSDPFGAGWLVKIRAEDPSSVDGLMDASTYDQKYPA